MNHASALSKLAALGCFLSAQAGITALFLGQLPSVGESSEALILLAPAPLWLAARLFSRALESSSSRSTQLLNALWRVAVAASALLIVSLLFAAVGLDAPPGWFVALVVALSLFGFWIVGMNVVAWRREFLPGWLACLGLLAGTSWTLLVASALADVLHWPELLGVTTATLGPLWIGNLATWLLTFPLWAVGLGIWCWNVEQEPRAGTEAAGFRQFAQ